MGKFHVLDEGDGYKVKHIEFLPRKRLSYQKHRRRAEHWFLVQGTARVTLNDEETTVPTGAAIDIALGAEHRVENLSSGKLLIFIEVPCGHYLGEDDIECLSGDFGR